MNIKSKLIDGIGLWSEVLTKNNYNGKPALFIDRDGTFIEDKGYLSNPKNIQLIELSCSFIKKCNDNLIPVIVVTNQSGIGRGYYSWKEFYEVEITIRKKLKQYNSYLDMVCACAYHSEGLTKYQKDNNLWRKPNTGMIKEAEKKLNIDLSQSWIVGDKLTDMDAGYNANLKGGIYLNIKNIDYKNYTKFNIVQQSDLSQLDWLIDELKS